MDFNGFQWISMGCISMDLHGLLVLISGITCVKFHGMKNGDFRDEGKTGDLVFQWNFVVF
jgi:hypothetical protein